MRADNEGEGGTIALLSLTLTTAPKVLQQTVLIIGLVGASLFFGDAMITPAISVLSAVEGLQVIAPALGKLVLPIACLLLGALFMVQKRGSARIGRLFGPVMLVWFTVLAVAGLFQIAQHPSVLYALNPLYAYQFLASGSGTAAFLVLGSVFLAVTGGEALYADMGHFGQRPIRLNWFCVVLPALVLNYLGQAAQVIASPSSAQNAFYALFPDRMLIPVVLLAAVTTVIASQAVISGAFTLVREAIQMGHVPRLTVRHTSRVTVSQVYLPQINWILAIAVIGLVLGFRSSESLANAYGLAVAGDMLATSLLIAALAINGWKIPWGLVVCVAVPFIALDLAFIGSNIHKIPAGGWFPLSVGAILLTLSIVWRKGRQALSTREVEDAQPMQDFLKSLSSAHAPPRISGTAVYLTGGWVNVPVALALNLQHNGVLHEKVLLLRIQLERVPRIRDSVRLQSQDFGFGLTGATFRFGFAEEVNVPAALRAHSEVLGIDPEKASFFVSRSLPASSIRPDLSPWEEVFSVSWFEMPPEHQTTSEYLLIKSSNSELASSYKSRRFRQPIRELNDRFQQPEPFYVSRQFDFACG